jgi:hypothetical protein
MRADDAALDDGGIAHAGSGSPLLMPMRAWQGAGVAQSSVLSSVKASWATVLGDRLADPGWELQRVDDDELVGLAAQAVAPVAMRQHLGGTSRSHPAEGIGPSHRQDRATMVIGCSTGADTGPSTT